MDSFTCFVGQDAIQGQGRRHGRVALRRDGGWSLACLDDVVGGLGEDLDIAIARLLVPIQPRCELGEQHLRRGDRSFLLSLHDG